MNALYKGVIVSGVLAAVAFYFITRSFMGAGATGDASVLAARWSAWC